MSKQDRKTAARAIADSAQQIWLAGLGAFSKAQAEGSRLFDQLIDEGTQLEQATRKYTKDKVDELRGRMEGTAERLQRSSRASIERIQAMIDQRVEQAVDRLAVPTREDIDALAERMRELGRQVAGTAAAGAAAVGASEARGRARPAAAARKATGTRARPAAKKAGKQAATPSAAKAGAGARKRATTATRSTAAKKAGTPAPARTSTGKAARKSTGTRASTAKSGAATTARSSRSATRSRGRSRR
jgi:poly(hydroxyalkanoate) granule-associated protein